MNMDRLEPLPPSLFEDLKLRARDVALIVCREYKDPDGRQEYRQILSEFDEQTRKAKQSVKVLKKLNQILSTLETRVEKIGPDTLCDVVREAHIPPDSPALLPIYGRHASLKDYLRIRHLPDPRKATRTLRQVES
jgi:hypothetical protein